jgi:hypothetical protein
LKKADPDSAAPMQFERPSPTEPDGPVSRPADRSGIFGGRSPGVYQRYRYLERLLFKRLGEQEQMVHKAQMSLDATLAKDMRNLIRTERRLRELGHLDDVRLARGID